MAGEALGTVHLIGPAPADPHGWHRSKACEDRDVLRRPDRVPRSGRAPMSPAARFAVLRWSIVGVWTALLLGRVVIAATAPEADLSWFSAVEVVAILLGLVLVVAAVVRARSTRRRREDEALALAVRRIDPTVWLVPAAPTPELRDTIAEVRPEVALGDRVTWAFGATEASLWELDDRKATRLLVIRWSRTVHVGLEDVTDAGGHRGCALVVHYVRPDDTPAVASSFIRTAPGSRRMLGRGPRMERLVAELGRERIVA